MSTIEKDTMHLLEGALNRYEAIGRSDTEFAVRDLLTDLRHYCELHEIDFDERLEGSLDTYLVEKDLEDD